jgi:hypothetical protein
LSLDFARDGEPVEPVAKEMKGVLMNDFCGPLKRADLASLMAN